jgi:hypothetical protein
MTRIFIADDHEQFRGKIMHTAIGWCAAKLPMLLQKEPAKPCVRATVMNMTGHLRNHLLPFFGTQQVREITTGTSIDFSSSCL